MELLVFTASILYCLVLNPGQVPVFGAFPFSHLLPPHLAVRYGCPLAWSPLQSIDFHHADLCPLAPLAADSMYLCHFGSNDPDPLSRLDVDLNFSTQLPLHLSTSSVNGCHAFNLGVESWGRIYIPPVVPAFVSLCESHTDGEPGSMYADPILAETSARRPAETRECWEPVTAGDCSHLLECICIA